MTCFSGKVLTRIFRLGFQSKNVSLCSIFQLKPPSFVYNINPGGNIFQRFSRKVFKNIQQNSYASTMSALSPLDPSSYSRPELAVLKHASISLNVNFGEKILEGSVLLTFNILKDSDDLILDVRDQTIHAVELSDGTPLQYTVDGKVQNFGAKLTINIPKKLEGDKSVVSAAQTEPGCGNDTSLCSDCSCTEINGSEDDKNEQTDPAIPLTFKHMNEKHNMFSISVRIKYTTSPEASALQWLDPNQTSGKKHPYLFSQCQPIHARSILPCQDTPAVKFTYDAEVTAPEQFTVLMSALRENTDGNKTYFRQPVPIPSYLVAIAVGNVESRTLGPRSKVWSEKEEIDRSAWEFAETEKYLQAAERLCGAYQWTQYDLLVLPPSFPYGGMENPCLTFVTPTLLAGDRSQANVIVHEIMHSWTGNLVTNRNFEHFWLNEGFTVFLERKVDASLIEDSVESKKSRDFNSLNGLQELSEAVETIGPNNSLTELVPNLHGVHPDDSFSRVPYEKGSLFLRYLEDLVGGPDVFDDFLRAYLTRFAMKSLDTEDFKSFILEYFKGGDKLAAVDWDAWLHKPGMPPVIPNYDTSMTKAITSLVSDIESGVARLTYDEVKSFTPHQMMNLLQELIDRPPLPLAALSQLGREYRVAASNNSEISYRWLRLCVRSRDVDRLTQVFDFVNRQGRMKYVRPLYRDLYAWEDVRARAIDNFLQNEKYMMHVSAYTIRKDLHLNE